jgi:hypothetical protein
MLVSQSAKRLESFHSTGDHPGDALNSRAVTLLEALETPDATHLVADV